jgi:DNA-directed RNA polymerase subunit RPC12/RpoP
MEGKMSDIAGKIYICEFCGREYSRTCEDDAYIGNTCFYCSFWLKKINLPEEDEARLVIVDGQHYRLGLNNSAPFRGFGGRKFTVVFHDGRMIETSCLWHQGEISEMFRQWLPDNAIFVPARVTMTVPTDNLGIPF